MSELAGAVRAALAERGEPISKLGYFCAPFRPASGPLADSVIKAYRGGRDPDVLELLSRRHDAYVAVLTQAGVRLPKTQFLILHQVGYMQPVIVQDALPEDTMLRPKIETADLDTALALLERAALSIASFWQAVAQRPERLGYHPSLRNFAIDADGPIFFDTFPPLIAYTREEMGQLLLRFSESWLIRTAGRLAPEQIRRIQDEWYSPSGTIIGLVGSAIRLRPDDRDAILDWARDFAASGLTGTLRVEVEAHLSKPPRLPAIWTGMRSVLGLEGKPNV